ncbi:uroporphyrinogen-III synthase [Brevundimonas vesicularis]|uniref:Uroporphyrinogen-III synthase n=1 Tax=Brevundimonas vesicularis TaxID=41276 RepID=A0A1Z3U9I9_BREVE|nr:uroporphyrinogen-III synthase [Brevundimonas vesicularis]ASE39938.1 uroporphyrinogen-III synthase [Brevundimonas vesicularis]MDX2336413.1 uroporphyrinogen-III synthase [Brevundimonas vesicularis]
MTAAPPRIWITRAEPGASRTAARLRDMGFEPIIAPLLAIENLTPPVPDLTPFTALAFTSLNGVAAFAALTRERDRPVFAVGDATAQAARDAGFAEVRSASGDLHALARLIGSELSDGVVLVPQAETPAGDFDAALVLAGARNVSIQPLIVYRAGRTPVAAPTEFDAVLIHSPRAAHILAEQGAPRLSHAITACISPAAAAPLVALGLTPAVAQTPDEATLLTILKAALGKRDAAV